mmetsp:Transcript_53260/g.124758  ORF Transcript_53260/g.124758 Transcript_53260/m.124758 type:complete len:101 (-) Transcript_53260:187-489(-)
MTRHHLQGGQKRDAWPAISSEISTTSKQEGVEKRLPAWCFTSAKSSGVEVRFNNSRSDDLQHAQHNCSDPARRSWRAAAAMRLGLLKSTSMIFFTFFLNS